MNDTQIFNSPPKNVEQYDYCIVFPLYKYDNYEKETDSLNYDNYKEDSVFDVSEEGQHLIDDIVALFGRYYVYQYNSICLKSNIRLVLIRVSISRIKSKAENIKFNMLLDEHTVQDFLSSGNSDSNIGPLYIPTNPKKSDMSPYQFIYGKILP